MFSAHSSSALPETLGLGHLNEVTIGLHWKGDLPENFDYDTEFDGQTGSLGPRSISAWAGYVGVGKTFRSVTASPRIFVEGNYASGTRNPAEREWNTFDQLYGIWSAVGILFNAESEWKKHRPENGNSKSNSKASGWPPHMTICTAAAELSPSPPTPGASPHVGDEIDLAFEYVLTEGLNFGFGYAHPSQGNFSTPAPLGTTTATLTHTSNTTFQIPAFISQSTSRTKPGRILRRCPA